MLDFLVILAVYIGPALLVLLFVYGQLTMQERQNQWEIDALRRRLDAVHSQVDGLRAQLGLADDRYEDLDDDDNPNDKDDQEA